MVLVDANYNFVTLDVRSYGGNSDGNIFAKSFLGKAIENDTLDILSNRSLVENGEPQPYNIVGDEAFLLKPYLFRLYRKTSLNGNESNKIFNYWLSKARRVVGNAFRILTARWRVLRTSMQVQSSMVDSIVLASCCLHNMLCQNNDVEHDLNEIIQDPGLPNTDLLRRNNT